MFSVINVHIFKWIIVFIERPVAASWPSQYIKWERGLPCVNEINKSSIKCFSMWSHEFSTWLMLFVCKDKIKTSSTHLVEYQIIYVQVPFFFQLQLSVNKAAWKVWMSLTWMQVLRRLKPAAPELHSPISIQNVQLYGAAALSCLEILNNKI